LLRAAVAYAGKVVPHKKHERLIQDNLDVVATTRVEPASIFAQESGVTADVRVADRCRMARSAA
jgi:hypothetical protein